MVEEVNLRNFKTSPLKIDYSITDKYKTSLVKYAE